MAEAPASLPNNALPSGGKFTHGSGSIATNGNIMNITGHNKNHVITWGGGFNIGSKAEVNFNTSHKQQASFLNPDYSNKASQILGKLNGNNHNIYLVNPSGVLIGQGASINANKFIASATSLKDAMEAFKKNGVDSTAASFSPVYKPNGKGNVVNMGSIAASEIRLVGNIVEHTGKLNGSNGKVTIEANKIQTSGDMTAGDLTLDSKESVIFTAGNISATNANLQGQTISFQGSNLTTDSISLVGNNGTLGKLEMNKGSINVSNGSFEANAKDIQLLGGSITAGSGITLDSKEKPLYLQNVNLTANGAVTLKGNDKIEVSNNTAIQGNGITAESKDILISDGSLDSINETMKLTATNGKLEINGDKTSLKGKTLQANAKDIAVLGGNISSDSVAFDNTGTMLLDGGTLTSQSIKLGSGSNSQLIEIGKIKIDSGTLTADASKVSLLGANIKTTGKTDITSHNGTLALQSTTLDSSGAVNLTGQSVHIGKNTGSLDTTIKGNGITAKATDTTNGQILIDQSSLESAGSVSLSGVKSVQVVQSEITATDKITGQATAGNFLMRYNSALKAGGAIELSGRDKVEIGGNLNGNGIKLSSSNGNIVIDNINGAANT